MSKMIPIVMIGVVVLGLTIGIYYILIVFSVHAHIYRKQRWIFIAGIFFALSGSVCEKTLEYKINMVEALDDQQVVICGRVVDYRIKEKQTYYIVRVHRIDDKRIYCKAKCNLPGEERLRLGQHIVFDGICKCFDEASNPGQFDEKTYYYGNNILFAIEQSKRVRLIGRDIGLREWLYLIKQKMTAVYGVFLDETEASLACAMVLGDKEQLDTEIKQLYQQNGIAHLITISGLHIAMIGGSLYQILRKLLGNYPMAAIAGSSFIFLYGIMTGLAGATTRAIIMLIMMIIADVIGKRYDLITAMFTALFIMLVWKPYQLFQAGFLLSFGAVFAIAYIYPLWKRKDANLPAFLDGFYLNVSVQIVTLPILLYYFYEIPLYGVFLNIIVVPLMGFLLVLLLLCSFLGILFGDLAVIPAFGIKLIFGFYKLLCEITEKIPFHTLCFGRPSVAFMLIWYGLLLIWIISAQKKRKQCVLLYCMIALICVCGVGLIVKPMKICMFDVGQGDAIYVRTPEGKHVLVDGGSSSNKKIGRYILQNGLKYYGAKHLDYVFVSHSDFDHYSGIRQLLEENLCQIDCMVFPAILNPDEAYLDLVTLAKKKGCRVYYMKQDDSLQLGKVRFVCISPKQEAYQDKNTGSLVLWMQYKGFDMMFTGDADIEVEQNLCNMLYEKYDINDNGLDVLKVAHHGSNTASGNDFLMRFHPSCALVSVGENNHYGHPSEEVMKRLSQYSKKIYLTKDSGAITIDTNGKNIQIRTCKMERNGQ